MSQSSLPASAVIAFAKMHGAGNDYVYIPLLTTEQRAHIPADLPELARRISDRHFGIGGDGMVLILPSEKADFAMRIFNADGSEAQMCGNATRCIGKYLYDNRYTDKKSITLDTKSGIKYLTLHPRNDGLISSVTVDMGIPKLNSEDIPANYPHGELILETEIEVAGRIFRITAVNMGNPHGVTVVEKLDDETVNIAGPLLENAPLWVEKANIEFIKVNNRKSIDMRVWERGSGETLACGTGACASVVAGVTLGLLDNEVEVNLRGGKLIINYEKSTHHVLMTGPAAIVATGYYYIPEDISTTDKSIS